MSEIKVIRSFKKPEITSYSLSDIINILETVSCGSVAFKCSCYHNCLEYVDFMKGEINEV